MIRFVDLRGQDVGARFAFFDTVSDTFIDTSDGDGEGVVWNTWQEFEAEIKNWERRFRRTPARPRAGLDVQA